jgi:glycine/D-amino acid oxidase-like deaminating enzyme
MGGAARAAHDEKMTRLHSWGYAVERLTVQQLAEMEPDIDPAAVGDASLVYYPEEGWLDPVPYAHDMVEAAMRHGARLRCGARVTHIDISSGRITGVRTADGEVLGADVVVNCAGPWADEIARSAGTRIPLAPRTGLLVITPPVPTRLQRVIHAPECSIRPDGGGRLMLHVDALDEGVRMETTPSPALPLAQEVVRRAARIFPALGDAMPEAVRIGVRPIPSDGYSAVGPMPGLEGYYVVVTHSGVTLAPFLGKAAADEIVRRRHEPLLEPFRPGRFLR